jgi:hypothetical protein
MMSAERLSTRWILHLVLKVTHYYQVKPSLGTDIHEHL